MLHRHATHLVYLRTIAVMALLWACGFGGVAHAHRNPFFEGLELLERGEYRKAVPFFEQALKENPEHAPTYSRLAECYENMGDYASALPHWQAYIQRKTALRDDILKHIALLAKLKEAEKMLGIESVTSTTPSVPLPDSEAVDSSQNKTLKEISILDKSESSEETLNESPSILHNDATVSEPEANGMAHVLHDRSGVTHDDSARVEGLAALWDTHAAKGGLPSLQYDFPRTQAAKGVIPILEEVEADRYRGSVIARKASEYLLPLHIGLAHYDKALESAELLQRNHPRAYTDKIAFRHGLLLRRMGLSSRSAVLFKKLRDTLETRTRMQGGSVAGASSQPIPSTEKKAESSPTILKYAHPITMAMCEREVALSLLDAALQLAGAGEVSTARVILKKEYPPFGARLSGDEREKADEIIRYLHQLEVEKLCAEGKKAFAQGEYRVAWDRYEEAEKAAERDASFQLLAEQGLDTIRATYRTLTAQCYRLSLQDKESAAEQYLAIADRFPSVMAYKAVNEAVMLLEGQKSFEKAVSVLADFSKRHSGSREGTRAFYAAGVLLEFYGKHEEAGKTFQAMMAQDDTPSRLYGSLGIGIMFYRIGKKADALQYLTKLAVTGQDDPVFLREVQETIQRMKQCSDFHPIR